MRIIQKVHERAERFYNTSKDMGELAVQAFRGVKSQEETGEQEKSPEKHRAQLTGLENVAETAHKVSDILDFIKKQFARQGLDAWRRPVPNERFHEGVKRFGEGGRRFGEEVKNFIEKNLKKEAEEIYLELDLHTQDEEGRRYQQYIHLELIRQFLRKVVGQYEYLKKEESQDAQRTGAARNTPDK